MPLFNRAERERRAQQKREAEDAAERAAEAHDLNRISENRKRLLANRVQRGQALAADTPAATTTNEELARFLCLRDAPDQATTLTPLVVGYLNKWLTGADRAIAVLVDYDTATPSGRSRDVPVPYYAVVTQLGYIFGRGRQSWYALSDAPDVDARLVNVDIYAKYDQTHDSASLNFNFMHFNGAEVLHAIIARDYLAKPTASSTGAGKPKPRLIRTARDAELVAAEWMRWMGFHDAAATPVGPDAGVDVDSTKVVAQVKFEATKCGRPALQRLDSAANRMGKSALFFASAGYTGQARTWADGAGMALFQFDLQGQPEPVNECAAILMRPRRKRA